MKNASKSKRGSVLLFTLVVFMFTLHWLSYRMIQYTDYLKALEDLKKVEKRLDIESEIISIIRTGETEVMFEIHDTFVHAIIQNEKISVITNGKMPYRFEYDIMEDGSFILNTMEDNYDFIK